MEDCRQQSGPSQGPGDGDREIPFALDAHLVGLTPREIALERYGSRRVAREWYPDSPMRATMRYRIKRGVDLIRMRWCPGTTTATRSPAHTLKALTLRGPMVPFSTPVTARLTDSILR